jgi:hypothetical protein
MIDALNQTGIMHAAGAGLEQGTPMHVDALT